MGNIFLGLIPREAIYKDIRKTILKQWLQITQSKLTLTRKLRLHSLNLGIEWNSTIYVHAVIEISNEMSTS